MIWVISFPWTNCETETLKALVSNWIESNIFRWNDDPKTLERLDWFVLAGGFSFEDRSRSWVIAAAYPIINILRKASQEWKPILWICNWAQILVESGLITDSIWPRISLSENRRVDKDWNLLWVWFYNTWSYLKSNKKADTFFNKGIDIINIPLAHWEWRFIVPEDEEENLQIVFQYCDKNSKINSFFPINPNWSWQNAAAISNKRWNVMAIMPHPERSENWYWVFASLFNTLKNKKIKKLDSYKSAKKIKIEKKEKFDIEIYVKLLITDNEAITIENVFEKDLWKWNVNLKKYMFIWINWISDNDFKKLEEAIFLWEFANFEKESLLLKKDWILFKYWKSNSKIKTNLIESWALVRNYDDIHALKIWFLFKRLWIKSKKIATWKYWISDNLNKIQNSFILTNPVAQFVEI